MLLSFAFTGYPVDIECYLLEFNYSFYIETVYWFGLQSYIWEPLDRLSGPVIGPKSNQIKTVFNPILDVFILEKL